MSDFGDYIRSERIRAGFSLRHLANQLGVSHVYLGQVERGMQAPLRKKWWGQLTRALPNVSVETLERKLATSQPLQIHLEEAPIEYQDLTLALIKRIEARNLTPKEIRTIIQVLGKTRNGPDR